MIKIKGGGALERDVKELQAKMPGIFADALNDIRDKAMAESRILTAKDLNTPVKNTRSAFWPGRHATPFHLTAVLKQNSRKVIPLDEWPSRQTAKGVSVIGVRRKVARLPHAFLAKAHEGEETKIHWRAKKRAGGGLVGRLPIVKPRGAVVIFSRAIRRVIANSSQLRFYNFLRKRRI